MEEQKIKELETIRTVLEAHLGLPLEPSDFEVKEDPVSLGYRYILFGLFSVFVRAEPDGMAFLTVWPHCPYCGDVLHGSVTVQPHDHSSLLYRPGMPEDEWRSRRERSLSDFVWMVQKLGRHIRVDHGKEPPWALDPSE